MEVGTLDLRLLRDRDDRNGFAYAGLVRVLECLADKRVVLDDAYIPHCVDFKASPRLVGFINKLLGLLHHRGETLAARVSGSGRSGVAEWADFLLLQVINRLEPLIRHLDEIAGPHPELLYRLLLPMAGELATFTTREKRPPEFPTYHHDALAATFLNSLTRCASLLLIAAGQLRNSTTHPDPEGLRNRLVNEVRTFEGCARARGDPRESCPDRPLCVLLPARRGDTGHPLGQRERLGRAGPPDRLSQGGLGW